MRDLIFKFGAELIAVRINNKQLQFCKLQGGYIKYSPIEGLKMSIAGILKEFPDLEDKDEKTIRRTAIERFKKHVMSLNNEEEIQTYLKKDLKKHGYELKWLKRPGFRRRGV